MNFVLINTGKSVAVSKNYIICLLINNNFIMAHPKLLGFGLTFSIISIILLIIAISTNYWYILDATSYERICPERNVFFPIFSERLYRKDQPFFSRPQASGLPYAIRATFSNKPEKNVTPKRIILKPQQARLWLKLKKDLFINLHSFGGRDISLVLGNKRSHLTLVSGYMGYFDTFEYS